VLTKLPQRGRAAKRNAAAQEGNREEPGGAAPEVEEVMHALVSTEGGLNARLRSVKFPLRPVEESEPVG